MALRNITLSADPELIDRARKRAEAKQTTLNHEFRVWLEQYGEEPRKTVTVEDIDRRLDQFSYFKVGKRFTREELNER